MSEQEMIKKLGELTSEVEKLNATVDVLVEKISMLKAVGCHG